MTSQTQRLFAAASVIAVLAAFPYMGATRYMLYLGTLFFIWAVVASYWNLLNGYAGIVSLGNMGFFAMGAYISSVLALRFGLSPWLAMFVAGLLTTVVVSVVLGAPVLRLRGIYIALLTLVFADSLPSIISLTREWTGGGVGLLGIPTLLGDLEQWQAYYFALVFFAIAHAVLYRIVHGRAGLAFVALRDSEDFAVAVGISRFREGLKVLAISSFWTALAGGLYAHILGQISPGMLGIDQFLIVIAMWMLGGVGTFLGPVLGAIVLIFGGEYLRVLGSLRMGLIGALIVVTVLFFPGGIMELLTRATSWYRQRRTGQAERSGSTDRELEPASSADGTKP